MAARTAYAPVAATVLTAANLAKLSGGWIGYAAITSDSAGVGASITDVGISVAVTVGSNRYIKITAFVPTALSTTGGLAEVRIRESTTDLASGFATIAANAYYTYNVVSVLAAPSAGAHTYKVSMLTSAGSLRVVASATAPAFILVEDMGSST